MTTRVKCSEYILLILQHWSMEHLEKHLLGNYYFKHKKINKFKFLIINTLSLSLKKKKAIEECIPYLVKDTAGSVQRIGIQLFWTFGPYWFLFIYFTY